MKNKKIILGLMLPIFVSIFLLALNLGIVKNNAIEKANIKIVKPELNQHQIAYLFSTKQSTLKCGEGKCGEGKDKKIEKEKDSSKIKLKKEEDSLKVEIKKEADSLKVETPKVKTNSTEKVKGKSAGHKKRDKKKKKKKRRNR